MELTAGSVSGSPQNLRLFRICLRLNIRRICTKISAVNTLLNDDFNEMLKLFCTKSKSWTCEQEWCSIHQEVGTLLACAGGALESVFFGPDIDLPSLGIVYLILAGQNSNIRFWRGRKSQEEFKVLLEEFTYTSFIEAKRHGTIT